jgi:hypothetical protein
VERNGGTVDGRDRRFGRTLVMIEMWVVVVVVVVMVVVVVIGLRGGVHDGYLRDVYEVFGPCKALSGELWQGRRRMDLSVILIPLDGFATEEHGEKGRGNERGDGMVLNTGVFGLTLEKEREEIGWVAG